MPALQVLEGARAAALVQHVIAKINNISDCILQFCLGYRKIKVRLSNHFVSGGRLLVCCRRCWRCCARTTATGAYRSRRIQNEKDSADNANHGKDELARYPCQVFQL